MNAYVTRYFKSNFGADLRPANNPKEKLIFTDYRAVWLNQKVSPEAQVYWLALSKVPQSIKDFYHYGDYKNQLTAIESRILAENNLPIDEKENLLITSSILRYSGYYWINSFKNGEVSRNLIY